MWSSENSRRSFINVLGMSVVAGSAGLSPTRLYSGNPSLVKGTEGKSTDPWFDKINGEYRVVFDSSRTSGGNGIYWIQNYFYSYNEMGVSDEAISALCVFRHQGAPLSLNDEMWDKYNLGELLGVTDFKTGEKARRNVFYKEEVDDPIYKMHGIKKMMQRGAMFCVCDLALRKGSAFIAQKNGLDSESVYKEWLASVLPEIHPVVSGIWAIDQAQNKGCNYIYVSN